MLDSVVIDRSTVLAGTAASGGGDSGDAGDLLVSRNPPSEGGIYTFETSAAATPEKAKELATAWGGTLGNLGIDSYQIRYLEPGRVQLCVAAGYDP